jgi:hypothetical protein
MVVVDCQGLASVCVCVCVCVCVYACLCREGGGERESTVPEGRIVANRREVAVLQHHMLFIPSNTNDALSLVG